MDVQTEGVSLANFEVQDNVLLANIELYWENHAEFIACCQQLIRSPKKEIILDLSQVSFVFSAYMGTIGRLLADAARENKQPTIRVNNSLSWLFDMVGFKKIVNIEIVP